ncbi:MAG: hypothetical protein WBE20_13470 [Candidatus Acidiferrales bacterium]
MIRFGVWLTACIFAAGAVSAGIQEPPLALVSEALQQQTPCAAPEYHQFDFWIGDWDGFDVDKPGVVAARNHVDRILDGCVLREDYRGMDGSEGQSFTIYDATRKVWHQTWVTNRGKLLVIEGNVQNGEMVLRGVDRLANGPKRQVRGTWKSVMEGVRETAVISTDGGKTWKPWFDMLFRPHRP